MGLLRDGGTPQIFGDGAADARLRLRRRRRRARSLAALGHDGGVFNVGTGVETSVLELAAAIGAASGIDREAALAPARLGELQRSVLDVSLAARELGWRPELSLAEGLAETWRWIAAEPA